MVGEQRQKREEEQRDTDRPDEVELGPQREAERRQAEPPNLEQRECAKPAGPGETASSPVGEGKGRNRTVLAAVTATLVIASGLAAALASGGLDGSRRDTPSAATTSQPTAATVPETEPITAAQPESKHDDMGVKVYFTDDNGAARVEPTELTFGKTRISGIVWTDWNRTEAEGNGLYEASDCEPDCATGSTVTANATIALTSPMSCGGKRQYSLGSLTTEDSSTGARETDDSIVSSELDCAQPRSHEAGASAPPPGDGSCDSIEFTEGSISCRRGLSIAQAAIDSGEGTPNDSVNVRGYDCYVYPYEVDCSSSTITFNTMFGANGA